ncbi:hypothetical protein AAFC00_001671 [Neodothiora populina]|uniref:Integral membrane bound transporter domain-containing protein n=1 Tax=Neodothiora populina TaxID=2781224 RepID=A0ABR3PPS7_9PEZI
MPTGQSSSLGRRFDRRNLRNATLILPRTGERVRRVFTLPALGQDSDDAHNEHGPAEERESLIGQVVSSSPRSGFTYRLYHARDAAVNFCESTTGQGIFKCSVAYLLGSLATFVPFISAFLGKQDGKHVVATVTVYFHPSRTAGSMAEAFVIAMLAFCYAAFIDFSSMGLSMALGTRGLLVLGHALVLIFFCGGGLGLVAWTKQRLGHPTVNVGCSLASLAIITVLTKEGSVQAAKFSEAKVVQVLKMVIMGMAATTAVNLLIKPRYARKELCRDMTKVTDILGDKLIAITRAFLSGSEEEMRSSAYQRLDKDYRSTASSMRKNLNESRWEHYVVGTEKQYTIEANLVRCLQRLSQNMGGLSSAAATQFTFLKTPSNFSRQDSSMSSTSPSTLDIPRSNGASTPTQSIKGRPTLESISETPEFGTSPASRSSPDPSNPSTLANSMLDSHQLLSPGDMFTTFIRQLGPPLKSLAFTLKQILDELPFKPDSDNEIAINTNFRSSLAAAIDLFNGARRDALSTLYRNKEISGTHSLERVADLEEVAASCGHFAAAMIDFAEDVVLYLDLLEELKAETEVQPRSRSWWWLAFWRKWSGAPGSRAVSNEMRLPEPHDIEALSTDITKPIKRADQFAKNAQDQKEPLTHRIYRTLRVVRRDDIRFAVKVGVGAALFALPSFLAVTRPFFSHWRGEWGLVSYMVVCSMTIGASNTTGFERFLGTALGAVFAIVAWIAADENPWLLGFFGWLVSIFCFYIILALGKGPMGRFILLTYNLSALYAYLLASRDDEDDDDEGGINPEIWGIVLHRFLSVVAGCIWGIIVTRVLWPISARRKLKDGICVLWLRMSLIWKRDPLAMFLLGEPVSNYMDIREEAELQTYLTQLDSLRKAAASEFELRAPFPDKVTQRILDRTQRMLDNFHAMNVVISKDLKASPGEAEVLRYTRAERFALSARISHLFSVLASSIKLEYPLNDVLPNIDHTRDRLLAKIFEFRRDADKAGLATEEDYELLYAYALVTGQLAQDIVAIGGDLEEMFGRLDEDSLRLY